MSSAWVPSASHTEARYVGPHVPYCHKLVQIHLTSGEGSVTRHFEYSISTLGGINHEKAFAGQRTLVPAIVVVSVLVFLIGAERTEDLLLKHY